MKFISKKDLRKLITKYCDDNVSLNDVKEIFEEFADDYFIVDGELTLYRKAVIEEDKKVEDDENDDLLDNTVGYSFILAGDE